MRWRATVTYRGAHGPEIVNHDIEELGQLEKLVEDGPHWECIDHIIITMPDGDKKITLQEALKL